MLKILPFKKRYSFIWLAFIAVSTVFLRHQNYLAWFVTIVIGTIINIAGGE